MAKKKFLKFKRFAAHLEQHDDLAGGGVAAKKAKWTGYATALGAIESISAEGKQSKKNKKRHKKAVRALHRLAKHAGGKKAVRPPKVKPAVDQLIDDMAAVQASNVVALRSASPVAAEGAMAPASLSEPREGTPDDLKMIAGIGPKLETVLHSLGIFHFDQIASWSPDDVIWVDDHLRFSGRIVRENWIGQAEALAKGGADEYVRVFGKEPR